MPIPMNPWLLAGKIGKAHGLKGQCFVHGTDRLIAEGQYAALVGLDEATRVPMTVQYKVSSRQRNIVSIKGIADRTGIDALYHQYIWLPPTGLDVWIGYPIVDCHQVLLGVIIGWEDFGASPMFTVHDATAGRTVAIALTADSFVLPLASVGDVLQLKVPKDHFADLWH